MEFLRKLFNPFGKGKQENKQVPQRPPSELLLFCRDIAGIQLQEHIIMLNDCKWIRTEYTYPAFDSMNFVYKNKVFSVIIDIQDFENNSYLPEEFIHRQVSASKQHNLIPCKFPIVVDNPHNPDIQTARALNKGWNLYNTITNEPVIPQHLATTEQTPLSEWELRNFSIMCIKKYLQANNMKILSFQDTLEVDPQMWFLDKHNKKCWIVIRCATYPHKVEKPAQLNEIIQRCFSFEGYFASITLHGVNNNANDHNVYRNGNVKIEFNNLEKIHSVL